YNPLDVASFGSSKNTPVTAPILGTDAGVDAVVAFVHKLQTPAQRTAYANGLGDSLAATGKPHLAIAPAALPEDQAALLQQRGVAVSSQSGAAFVALKALFDAAQAENLAPAAAVADATGTERVLNEW